MLAGALIRAGEARMIVAGGMENMTRGPHLLPQARAGYRLGNGELVDATVHDGLWCAVEYHHMGNSAEWIARHFDVGRAAQDAFAQQSHARAIAAQDARPLRRRDRSGGSIGRARQDDDDQRRRAAAPRYRRQGAGRAAAGLRSPMAPSRPATPPASPMARRRWW